MNIVTSAGPVQLDIRVGDRKQLLLVDDEPEQYNPLCHVLNEQGVEVHIARNVADAFASLERGVPQYAVIGRQPPRISTIALIQYLKELNPSAVIVLLTENVPTKTIMEASERGAIACAINARDTMEILAALDVGS